MPSSLVRLVPKRLTVPAICIAVIASLTVGVASAETTLPTLGIALTPTSVTVTGTPLAGGVNVITTASGKVKEPSVILIKLDAGKTPDELFAFLTNPKVDPNEAKKFGAIVFDAETKEGKPAEVQTTLEAGEYAAILVGEKGPANVHAVFTVGATPTPAALPTPSAKIKSIEFGFKGPSTIKQGSIVGFEDGGFLVHMDIAFPAKSKKGANEILTAFRTGHEKKLRKLVGGEPFTLQGPVSPGGYQQETITAKPGYYVQVCFMETQDGRPHTLLGMERIFKIVK
jgi:hypothetical protein